MASIYKTEIDRVDLSDEKYIIAEFNLHTGEFETDRYALVLDLEKGMTERKDKRVNTHLSIARMLTSVAPPEKQEGEDDA